MWTSARAGGWEPGTESVRTAEAARHCRARDEEVHVCTMDEATGADDAVKVSHIHSIPFREIDNSPFKCRDAIGASWPATDGCDDDKPTPCAPTRRKLWHQRSVHETAIGQHLY
jgi:hypothetical protein